ncbi:MAG: homocysteine S-methyltransferase family protein [Candidatus Omnitrophota bacterium]
MKPKSIQNILKYRPVVLDGATGTELYKRGMPCGICPEIWALDNYSIVSSLQREYADLGADVVFAPTFGANRIKLKNYKLDKVEEINKNCALLSRKAVGKNTLVGGDIGPTGKFIEPFGSLSFDEAVDIFKEQARGLLKGGVDFFIIETMIDIQEARAALLAVKELTDKFVMVSMTFEADGRTLNGNCPEAAVVTLQGLGANAVGCNCSVGPQAMVSIIKRMKPYSKVPLLAKPNAGMPKVMKSKTVFPMGAKEFASFAAPIVSSGAGLIGGCCGTTPRHISLLKRAVSRKKPKKVFPEFLSVLSSASSFLPLDRSAALGIVGECINPTGKPRLRKELSKRNFSYVREIAVEQEKNNACLLDVNVASAAGDEESLLCEAVKSIAQITGLPLVIDSSNISAVENALRVYPGRALINSIPWQKGKTDKLLKIAAKYGAMFIVLPIDHKNVPLTSTQRQEVARKILAKAKDYGLNKEDAVVDALVMALSTSHDSAKETLSMIEWCSRKLGMLTIIGLSNVSFGLPGRQWLNAAFMAAAYSRGLRLAIADPSQYEVTAIKTALNAAYGLDPDAKEYIDFFRKSSLDKGAASANKDAKQGLFDAILHGDRQRVNYFIDKAIAQNHSPSDLVSNTMIPAIKRVGELYEQRSYFLPQLIASAETTKRAFLHLKPLLSKKERDKDHFICLMATVEGDVHDIGKNIVGLILGNHGFKIVDMGKDVSANKIVSEAKRLGAHLVGLSALMTTTMLKMNDVVKLAKKEGLKCKFIVGGAAVSSHYADSIGAEYAKDAIEAVKVAKRMIGKKG